MALREVIEGTQQQGCDEEIAYSITTTNWGSSPTSPSVEVFRDPHNSVAITEAVMPTNSPMVNGDIITLSPLKNLTIGVVYRIEVKFSIGSNVFECYFKVQCY